MKVNHAYILFLFFLVNLFFINSLGLHYDETLFSNVALSNRSDGLFITHKINNFVLHLYYYIGSLKAYLFKFLFFFFEPNVYSVRIPMLLLFCISILILINVLKYKLKQNSIIFFILITLLNPDFYNYIIHDVGPNGLELISKCLIIFILFGWKHKNQLLKINLIGIICLLAVFNKLNFTWQILSYLFSYTLYFLIPNRLTILQNKRILFFKLSNIVFYIFLILIYTKYNFKLYSWTSKINLEFKEIKLQFEILLQQLIGINFNNSILNGNYFIYVYILSLIILLILIFYFLNSIIKRTNKLFLFFFTVFLFNFFQIIITDEAIRSWHIYAAVFPEIPICLLLFYDKINIKIQNFKIITLFCFFSFFFINTLFSFKLKSEEPKNIAWSPTFYKLKNYLVNKNKTIIINDWGFTSNLIIYDSKKNKYLEKRFGCWDINNNIQEINLKILPFYSNFLILSHGKINKIFCDNSSFESYLNNKGYKLVLVKKFLVEHKSIYEIHKIEKNI